MKPGIYSMPAAEYHALPFLSNSLAKVLIEQSPLHAWTASPALNPNFEREEKWEFDLGSAAHAMLLEGGSGIEIVDAADWRTDKARAARDAARAAGKYPVLKKRHDDLLKMRDVAVRAIAECDDLSGLSLAKGRVEHVVVWEEEGVTCRARVDFLATGELVVLDYKSTTDATPRAFSRQIARMGYHYQDDFYSRGIAAVFGRRPKFVFLAQETTAPYACSFHGCAPSLLALAAQDVAYAMRAWGKCLAANRWPSHDNRIHWAEALPWQVDVTEERTGGIEYDPGKLWGGMRPQEGDAVRV